MKTYESERKELHDWIDLKNKEYSEEIKNDAAPTQGYDGESTYKRQQIVCEYNRRLRELKEKYNRA